MGAQEPAFLLRSTVNLEQSGSPRNEHLSTGLYTLMDVICSGCHSPMGWQYLQASHEVCLNCQGCELYMSTVSLHVVHVVAGSGGGVFANSIVSSLHCMLLQRLATKKKNLCVASMLLDLIILMFDHVVLKDQKYKEGATLLRHSMLKKVHS